jgi:V/A-type H+-transporting ATPase subunit I
MAVAQMIKVMIVTHRSQASQLLETLQREGICQILNAEEAIVSKDAPDLVQAAKKPGDIETLLARLQRSIVFLKSYAQPQKGFAAVLSPRTVVDERAYNEIISDAALLEVVDESENLAASIEKTTTEIDNLNVTLDILYPWESLATPVEQIGQLQYTVSWPGLIPSQHFNQVEQDISQFDAAIQQVGTAAGKHACIIVSLTENAQDVQKLLRSAEFEPVHFESMKGTAADLIRQYSDKLNQARQQLQNYQQAAVSLSKNLLKLQILHDHYKNLLQREQTRDTAPATQHTVILEGWVKRHDYPRLEKVISQYEAASLTQIKPAEDEQVPVEIENKNVIKPFEVITRLYGMPRYFEVDPTKFLAPFFAIFFALCLTDAGYGLVIIAVMIFLIKKLQGDKRLMWMLGICSAVTIVAGALTGGWFGDAIQQFLPVLKPVRNKMLWFDPFENPMMFFGLSLAIGYIQIQAGLLIALVYNLKRRDLVAAVCDQATWLVMLNSIVLFGAGKAGVISPLLGTFFGRLALVPAIAILLFSHREGSWAGRIGMGAYNLFSTIFYVGDVLSYLRLMALGMVTAGIAMAVNVIAKISLDIPYGIGVVVMILVLIGGHGFNIAMSGLGAFVHTLRLQYVEFFPKFFAGGGRKFEPLAKKYEHVYIKNATGN